jgi:hypothetical protein
MKKMKKLFFTSLAVFALAVVMSPVASAHGSNDKTFTPDSEKNQFIVNLMESISEKFGISIEELQEGKAEGKTFLEILQNYGISEEDLENFKSRPGKTHTKVNRGILLEYITEVTGLDDESLKNAKESGVSLRDLLSEAGYDLREIINDFRSQNAED